MKKFEKNLLLKINSNGILNQDEKTKIYTEINEFIPTNEIEKARIEYIKNIFFKKTEQFYVPAHLNILEQACMKLSFNDYENINMLIDHKIIGMVPTSRGTYEYPIMVIKCKISEKRPLHKFKCRNYEFDNFLVEALAVHEQIALLIEMIKIFNLEKALDLRNLKVQAYIDRLLFEENEENALLKRVVFYYDSIINNQYKFLENIVEEEIEDSENIFITPLVLYNDILIQLAEAYYVNGWFQKALDIFKNFDDKIKIMNCYVNLNENNEAIKIGTEELQRINNPTTQKEKIRVCNIEILLGVLTNDDIHFDRAFQVYKSYEPKRAKAMLRFKQKNYKEALCSFKEALEFAPRNVELKFFYASCLSLLNEFEEAIKVYQSLLGDDPKNVMYLRNISMCYLKLEDVSSTMQNLKKAAMYDSEVMKAYFLMAIKYNLYDEIIYSLEKVGDFDSLEEGIEYLIESKTVNKETVKKSLEKNAKLNASLNRIFEKLKI